VDFTLMVPGNPVVDIVGGKTHVLKPHTARVRGRKTCLSER
jgi:hypothetical protein